MALVIEDGTIVAGANSYITVDEYKSWANARFGSGRTTAPACDPDTEQLILRATDWFENNSFQGCKVESDQSLQWPRSWVVIDTFAVESNEIPPEVKTAIYEIAYAEEAGDGQLDPVEREVKKEKVGDLEVEYMDGSPTRTQNVAVSRAMKKLLACNSVCRVVRV